MRCSIPYYGEMKGIYEGRLGALETLFSCGVACMVHVHKRVYGRSTAYFTIKKIKQLAYSGKG